GGSSASARIVGRVLSGLAVVGVVALLLPGLSVLGARVAVDAAGLPVLGAEPTVAGPGSTVALLRGAGVFAVVRLSEGGAVGGGGGGRRGAGASGWSARGRVPAGRSRSRGRRRAAPRGWCFRCGPAVRRRGGRQGAAASEWPAPEREPVCRRSAGGWGPTPDSTRGRADRRWAARVGAGGRVGGWGGRGRSDGPGRAGRAPWSGGWWAAGERPRPRPGCGGALRRSCARRSARTAWGWWPPSR